GAGCPHSFSADGSQLATHGIQDGAFQVWDLRLIRKQLKELDLDWDLPPYSTPTAEPAAPLRVQVVAAKPQPPSAELDAQAHFERGLLYVQLGRHAVAAESFRRADSLAPERISWDDVIRAYADEIARNPQNADLYHERALAYARMGQWEKAI